MGSTFGRKSAIFLWFSYKKLGNVNYNFHYTWYVCFIILAVSVVHMFIDKVVVYPRGCLGGWSLLLAIQFLQKSLNSKNCSYFVRFFIIIFGFGYKFMSVPLPKKKSWVCHWVKGVFSKSCLTENVLESGLMKLQAEMWSIINFNHKLSNSVSIDRPLNAKEMDQFFLLCLFLPS